MTVINRRQLLRITAISAGAVLNQRGTSACTTLAESVELAEDLLARTLPAQALAALSNVRTPERMGRGIHVRFQRAMGICYRDIGLVQRGFVLSERVREMARHDGNRHLYSESTVESIICLMNAGQWTAASTLLHSEQNALRSSNDRGLDIEIDFWLARILESSGHISESLELAAARVLPGSRAHESAPMQIARHSFVCRLALSTENPDWAAAESAIVAALSLQNSATPPLRRGQLLTAQAHYLLKRKDFDGATVYLDDATNAFSEGGIVSPNHRKLSHALAFHQRRGG